MTNTNVILTTAILASLLGCDVEDASRGQDNERNVTISDCNSALYECYASGAGYFACQADFVECQEGAGDSDGDSDGDGDSDSGGVGSGGGGGQCSGSGGNTLIDVSCSGSLGDVECSCEEDGVIVGTFAQDNCELQLTGTDTCADLIGGGDGGGAAPGCSASGGNATITIECSGPFGAIECSCEEDGAVVGSFSSYACGVFVFSTDTCADFIE